MTLTHNETKELMDLVLRTRAADARLELNIDLKKRKRTEPEFYAGVLEHGPGMEYSSEQWFDFLSKIPSKLFFDDSRLTNKLSESQRAKLPPAF